MFRINDTSRIVRVSRDNEQASQNAQILQKKLRITASAHPTRPLTNGATEISLEEAIWITGIDSDIFAVVQADTLDSERSWFNTGRAQATKDDRASKRKQHALYPSHRETEPRNLDYQPQVPDKPRWCKWTCGRVLAGRMPIFRQEKVSSIKRRARAEKRRAVPDNATRMRAGLQRETLEPTEP